MEYAGANFMRVVACSLFLACLTCAFEYSSSEPDGISAGHLQIWPDTIVAAGQATPNASLPEEAGAAGATRAATLLLYRDLLDSIYALPVGPAYSVEYLAAQQSDSSLYSRIAQQLHDTIDVEILTTLPDGTIRKEGHLSTQPYKVIVRDYLE